ncbi:hypothetical protein SNE40_002794 [Patella caerulea]|uniref:Uncharacterized protein n=2 Tax=Patella caerulea TaxID=87958 RepID=A0AAN8Q442_PATCE
MIGSKMNKIAKLETYKDVITKVICDPPLPLCNFRKCHVCRDFVSSLQTELMEAYNDHAVDDQQWTSTDRPQLHTVTMHLDEFAENFSEKVVIKLVRHDFKAKSQSAFLKQKKEVLVDGEFVVIGDFSDNFPFVVQDVAQGYHWNNAQAAIHPWVITTAMNKTFCIVR